MTFMNERLVDAVTVINLFVTQNSVPMFAVPYSFFQGVTYQQPEKQ